MCKECSHSNSVIEKIRYTYQPDAKEFRRYWTRTRSYNKEFLERYRLINEEIKAAVLFDINYKVKEYVSIKKSHAVRKVSDFFANWDCVIYKGQRNFMPIVFWGLTQGSKMAMSLSNARLVTAFDAFNPRAVKYCTKESLKLITLVSENTRKGIQKIIQHGIENGKSVGAMANNIKDIVGLDAVSTRSYINYENKLISQGISGKEYEKLMKLKRIDLQNYRAIRIARTEANRALNNGAVLGYAEVGYETVIWAGGGGNICPYCSSHLGTEYTIEKFLGVLPAHPSCMCYPRMGTRKKSILTTIGVT